MKTIVKIAVATCLLSQSVCFAAGESVDRIVAIVNNDVVTSSELNHQTSLVKQELQHAQQAVPNDKELRKQVLQRMVDLNLQLQYASKSGIIVSDKDINDAMDRIANRNHLTVAEMKEQITRDGISIPEYRDNLRKQIIISQLHNETIAKQIRVSDDEVKSFLKSPSSSSADDMLFELEDILIPLSENPTTKELQSANKEAQAYLQKLNSGAAFSSLSVPKSLGWRSLREIPEVFAAPIAKLSAGQFAGPIRAGNGIHFVKLLNKKAGSVAEVSPDQAREFLFRRRFEERVDTWIQQLRARSYVKMMLDAPSDVA